MIKILLQWRTAGLYIQRRFFRPPDTITMLSTMYTFVRHLLPLLNSVARWWKFHDFSITQILREITFRESRGSKTVVFAVYGAVNSANLVNSNLLEVQKLIKIKIQSL